MANEVRVPLRVEATGNAPAYMKELAARAEQANPAVRATQERLKALDDQPVKRVAAAYQHATAEAERLRREQERLNREAARAPATAVPASLQQARPIAGGGRLSDPYNAAGDPYGIRAGNAQPGQAGEGLAKGFTETASKLAVLGGTLALIGKAGEGLAKAMNDQQNRHLSATQKLRSFEESIPILGDLAKGRNAVADAVTGKGLAAQDLAKSQAVTQQTLALQQQQFQAEQPLVQQQLQAKARAAALGAAPGIAVPNRNDFASQQDYDDARRRVGPLSEQRTADANAQAARQVLRDQEARQAAQEQKVREASEKSAQLKADADRLKAAQPQAAVGTAPGIALGAATAGVAKSGGLLGVGAVGAVGGLFGSATGSPANALRGASPLAGSIADSESEKKRLEALSQVDKAIKTEQQERQKLLEITKQTGEAGKAAAEAESQARKAAIGVQREELAILKEKEQRISSNAKAFGQLNDVEKSAAVAAAQRAKSQGYETLTPEERQLISQAGGGQFLSQAAEQNALKDERFRQFNDLLGQQSDLKGTREQIAKLDADIQLNVEFDTKALEDKLASVITKALEQVERRFADMISNVQRDVEVGLDVMNASR